MTWSPDGTITGQAQTGFVTPAYTVVEDTPPAVNAKQLAVTALTGTQTGANAGSISKPFTAAIFRPASVRQLPTANPVSGLRGSIPNNTWNIVVRKGGEVAAGVPANMVIRCSIAVPAGMDSYSAAEVRAAMSFFIGLLVEESADLGDTIVSGIL
jgi:hypothetical protein